MTRDELIRYCEYMHRRIQEYNNDEMLLTVTKIALATLKITNNGYAIVSKEYGDMIAKTMEDELVHIDESYKDYTVETELDEILKELE